MELTAGRRRLLVGIGLVAVVAAVLAMPVQGYWAQRGVVAAKQSEVAELERRNDELTVELERLDDPDELRRTARRDYGLVEPGEESYSVLPPATAGLVLPGGWPFDRLSGPLARAATGGS